MRHVPSALLGVIIDAIVVLLAVFFLPGCGAPFQLTLGSVAGETKSTTDYFTDRDAGWPFRGDYYDSARAWVKLDTARTKFFEASIDSCYRGDSLNLHGDGFYAAKLKRLRHELDIISLTAKP